MPEGPLSDELAATVTGPSSSGRFFNGYPWRWVVLAIADPGPGSSTPELQVLTLLDHLALDAAVDLILDDPAVATLRVPSDSPEVNILHTDGDPFVDEGNRALIGFRREGTTGTDHRVWVPRFAGIIMQPEDAASNAEGAGNAYTTIHAYDPWQILYRRPARDSDGSLADDSIFAGPANAVVLALLAYSEAVDGPTFIDVTNGTIETLDPISITVTKGQSVGEIWKQLCDSGYCDLVLTPIYDPFVRPDKLVELNVFDVAGDARYGVPFAWDLPGRTVVTIGRGTDGQQRSNKVQFYNGQGGPPVPVEEDAPSIARNGVYYTQQFFPALADADVVQARAVEELRLRKDGVVTIRVSPAPERSPIPLVEYVLGDEVPIFASARFRKLLFGTWRVTKIPIRIRGRVEAVEGIEVTTEAASIS